MGGKQSKRTNKPLVDPAYFPDVGVKKQTTSSPGNNNNHRSASRYDSIGEDWPWVWGIREPKLLDWKIGLSDDQIIQRSKLQQDLPVKISEDLYLGSALSVQRSVSSLVDLGITAVLNLAGPMALKTDAIDELEAHGISYKQINAQDESSYPLMERHWEEAYEFIKLTTQATEEGKKRGKCVVHCVAGINRSALVAAVYYMIETQSPVLETVKHIRTQRGNMALSNEGFQQQLVAMARLHDLLGLKPGDEGCIIEEQAPPQSDSEWIFAPLKERENPVDRLTF